MKKTTVSLMLILMLAWSHTIWSQADSPKKIEPARYGLGFQRITYNCWGLSLMVNLSPRIAVEGLYGLIGDRQAYGLRSLFRFLKFNNFNVYGYGLIGAEKVEEWGASETGLLVGGGIGVEYNFERILADLISFGLHAEMGVENLSGYVVIDASYTSFIYSAGFHIRI
jgi:hypothetical protein